MDGGGDRALQERQESRAPLQLRTEFEADLEYWKPCFQDRGAAWGAEEVSGLMRSEGSELRLG